MRIGLIGAGQWGKNHANSLAKLRDAGHLDEVVVCDANVARGGALARSLNAPFVDDATLLFKDPRVEGVILATPTPSHHPLARAALEAGKHVLVEKPLARTYAEALELVAVAERAGRTLMVGHVFRYHSAVAAVRDMIARGELGRVLYLWNVRQAFREPRPDMGVLHALGVHEVDLFCWLLGREWPTTLWASSASWHLPGIEELSFVHMTFPGGVHAHAMESWYSPTHGKERYLVVAGSQASAYVDYMRREVVLVDDRLEPGPAGLRVAGGARRTIPLPDAREPLEAEQLDFLSCIRTGAVPVADAACGARAVRMVEAALAMGEGAGAVRFDS